MMVIVMKGKSWPKESGRVSCFTVKTWRCVCEWCFRYSTQSSQVSEWQHSSTFVELSAGDAHGNVETAGILRVWKLMVWLCGVLVNMVTHARKWN